MENKQTAVEWLALRLPNIDFRDDPYYKILFEQAKAMEKEQIRDAYEADTDLEFYRIIDTKFEKYYKKTYGK